MSPEWFSASGQSIPEAEWQVVPTATFLRGLSGWQRKGAVYVEGRASEGDGGEGTFRWDSSNLAAEVSSDEVAPNGGDGGIYIAPDADKTGASGAWVRQGVSEVIDPRWYGAVYDYDGSAGTDNTRAIQLALDAANRRGGGIVVVDGPAKCSSAAAVPGVHLSHHLRLVYDDVWIRTTPRGKIVFTGDGRGFAIGRVEAGGDIHAEPVYTLSGTYSVGDIQLTLATPAEVSNFQAEDWIYIRTGQTLTGSSGQPDAEWNKVVSVDAGAGTINLAWPLTKDYAQEDYPPGHAEAGNPAPFGVSNGSRPVKLVTEGGGIIAAGVIEQKSDYPIFYGNQAIGLDVSGRFVSAGAIMSCGWTFGSFHDFDCEMPHINNRIGFSADKGSTGFQCRNGIIRTRGLPSIHLHEGCQGDVSGVTVLFSNEGNVANRVLSGGGRTGVCNVSQLRIVSGNYLSAAVFMPADSRGGMFSDIRVEGPGGKIIIDGTGFTCSGLDAESVFVLSPNRDNTYEDGVIRLSMQDFFALVGAPTQGIVNSQHVAWSFDPATEELIYASVRIPRQWQKVNVRILWANSGAGSGDVVWKAEFNGLGVGGSLGSAPEYVATTTETAGAQDVLVESVLESGVFLADGEWLSLALGRAAANAADTLANDAAIVAVTIERFDNF